MDLDRTMIARMRMSLGQLLVAWLLLLAGLLHATPAMAIGCSYATGKGTAPSDYLSYCWLDFSSYNDTAASSATGQAFTYNLPDGSTLTFTLKVTGTGATPYLHGASSPSWSGAAFGNSAFTGIPNQPVLYQSQNGATVTATLSNIALTPPGGGVSNYAFIAADGESTNNNENVSFTTNGSAWQQLATVPNGAYFPTLAGVGTTTVTETGTQDGAAGSYVFGSFNNPTSVSSTFHGSGLEGVIFGVRFASISLTKVINGTRLNASDQFTYSIKTTGGTTLASGTTSGSGPGPFTLANVPTVAASFPFVLSEVMAGGSASALANYSTVLNCVNNATSTSSTPLPTNQYVTTYTIPSLQFGDAIACTFTNSPYPTITGFVYNDANKDGNYDPAGSPVESGTGVSGLFVKLAPYSGGSCQSPATAAASVNAASGAYLLPTTGTGSYCLILDDNNTLSDITPSAPAGWFGTEAASGIRQLTISNTSVQPSQNYGLYQGVKLTGTVFADTGIGSGTANNGVKDGTETGMAGVVVNAVSGTTTIASATTDGVGSYVLLIPASVSGSVVITAVPPSGALPTGGSAGTSGGTYARPSVTINMSSGLNGTGVNFGLVPANTFSPDGAKSAQPGTVVFYAHTYVAASGGQISFSSSAIASPSVSGWVETIYRDVNCNGQIDVGDTLVVAAIAASAGQSVCVVVKEFVPANAPMNGQNKVVVTALFNYTNASPALSATLTNTDTTTVGIAGEVQLSKLVNNITQGSGSGTSNNANPGDTLQYQLVVKNPGSASIGTLVVNDSTPSFTQFVSAGCPAVSGLPPGLTGCSVVTQPSVGGQGALRWTFTGSLLPSAQVIVSFQVIVSP